MSDIVVHDEAVNMTAERARELDHRIVSGITDVREAMLEMYEGELWRELDFQSWDAYLGDLSGRTGFGSKYLRRVNNAGLLEAGGGYEIGEHREGTVRPINETLSDAKGFTRQHRIEALDLAHEQAGDGKVTAQIAQAAAWYIAVKNTTPSRGSNLIVRLEKGEISSQKAYELCQIMRGKDAIGLEQIMANTSDPDLARFLIKVRGNSPGGETWNDIYSTIMATGMVPTANGGQVPLEDATAEQLQNYLNEPLRMKRYEKVVDEGQANRRIAKLSAKMMASRYGVSTDGLPHALALAPEIFPTEVELYRALQESGLLDSVG